MYKAAASLCVYVCLYPPPFDTTVGLQPNLAGKCGLSWELYKPKTFDPPNPRGDFRWSKIQKSGKCHEVPRKSIMFFNPHHTLGLGVLEVNISKVHELSRKLKHFLTKYVE